jgi:peptidyl-prolyl cis-trans isomerase C
MKKTVTLFAGAALALSLALPAAAEDAPTLDTVVATVNGTQITLGHMLAARQAMPAQFRQLPDNVLFGGLLNQLIQQTLLAQSVGEPEPARVRIAVENERRMMLAGMAIDSAIGSKLTESAVEAAYTAKYKSGDPKTEWNASHILVPTREEAEAIVAELAGGADFADVARAKSTGPSGPNGGELGWFGAGMMVEAFETAVAGMAVGQVSDPVNTQFGWHVIRLNETRVADAPPLDEVRAELEQEVQREIIEAHIRTLESGADVTRPGESLDPSVLSRNDLLDN